MEFSGLQNGAVIIRETAKTLPESPGVYRMIGQNDDILYIGKARALKRRVSSYAQVSRLTYRLQRMVSRVQRVEVIHTNTEVEALLLEANLIKQHKPPYNVLLRDDKSFPYITITSDHAFPMMTKYRGNCRGSGEFFGPYVSAGSVMQALNILQRAFMLRNCSDSYFAARKRPCLQYHIKRCTAPCVGYVSQEDYHRQVSDTRDFLAGKTQEIQEKLANQMQEASQRLDYELAAQLRDRIRALAQIQASQTIANQRMVDCDSIGIVQREGITCIAVTLIRKGHNLGTASFWPDQVEEDSEIADVLQSFLTQFYLTHAPPPVILCSHELPDDALLQEALSDLAGRKVTLSQAKRGERLRLIDLTVKNAEAELKRRILKRQTDLQHLKSLADLFQLPHMPERIEIYDNSHTGGKQMVGVMVVAGPDGFNKKAYRTFKIKEAGAADDFAMMREVFSRRFRHIGPDSSAGDDMTNLPDLVLIDGGAGQLSAASAALYALGVQDTVHLVAISKGPDRNAGNEILHQIGYAAIQLNHDDPVLHYLQRLRDEAHRFAIGTHRKARQKDMERSPLDTVHGIGAKRKKALLLHFGSAKAVARASIEDLQRVDGVSNKLAQEIYQAFHSH